MSTEKDILFSNEALARFVAAQGRSIEKIICHLWQNITNKDAPIEIIDNVEFHFSDGNRLTISCNADGDGMDAIDYDYKTARAVLEHEFGGKIRIFAVDASSTKMWADVVGKKLEAVRLSRSGDHYRADALIMDFGDEKREITIAPLDGLVIDYYEE